MDQTALITGASDGIGEAMARLMSADHINLVIVARRVGKLQQLKAELEEKDRISVRVIPMDLSDQGSAARLYEQTQDIHIDYLINNAGFGVFGHFAETDFIKEHHMMMLNMVTFTELAKLYGADMMKRGKGAILNVSSTAAFQPGPYMAVYYATKAYVESLSEALSEEFKGTGVTVTALCPGPTATGFQKAANIENITLLNSPFLPNARKVAVYGYKAMKRSKRVAIYGNLNRFVALAVRITPRPLVTYIVKKIQQTRSKPEP